MIDMVKGMAKGMVKDGWFEKALHRYSKLGGYAKPEYIQDALKLDSNENYVIPRQFQQEVLSGAKKASDVREYPLDKTARLVTALAEFVRAKPYQIGIGNGSDQILDMILGHFATKSTTVLAPNPTFGFFEDRCRLYSIPMDRASFSDDMRLDAGEFLRRAEKADMLYIDSPNNPTGFQFARSDMRKIISSFDGPIIIDEAYGEFSDYTAASMAKSRDNLIIVRTLSKSFGLAGLRLGYFVADREFADVFNRVLQYPYPLSTITIEAGILALSDVRPMRDAADRIKSERSRIIDELRGHGAFDVFDSKANFVLFDARGAHKRVFTALSEQGILIRQLGRIGSHKGCLRVTVGTREMNSKFLLAVRDLLR